MSQFQMPINIYQAMEYINNNYYLLPAFQREFVWKSEQIEKLFDSLMRGYPTSSMLFWKVEGSTKTKWKFYKFISSYVRDAKDHSITNELYNTYHKNIYDDFTNKVGYKDERIAIKNWLFSSILRKTFGGQSDSTLQQTRKYFTEDIAKSSIDADIVFDGDAINKKIKNLASIDDSFFEELFSVQKDNLYAFPVLSLLYPHLDYKNNDFHKDHIHAENLYQFLPEDLKQKYPFKVYNSILNLQMLDKNENESKGQKALEEWVSLQCPQPDSREGFLRTHLIPNVNLSLSNFEEFIEKRKELIKKKILEILV